MRCGKIDPGIAATASTSSRISAVRIEVSWRQPQRSHPTKPRRGCVIESSPSTWSDGRSGSLDLGVLLLTALSFFRVFFSVVS